MIIAFSSSSIFVATTLNEQTMNNVNLINKMSWLFRCLPCLAVMDPDGGTGLIRGGTKI